VYTSNRYPRRDLRAGENNSSWASAIRTNRCSIVEDGPYEAQIIYRRGFFSRSSPRSGFASRALEKKAAVEAATVQARCLKWTRCGQTDAEPLVVGMTIGVSVDAQDNVWIIHRGGSLEAKERTATRIRQARIAA